MRHLVDWFFHTEGSSRAAGLVRIGLALVAWARLAGPMMPLHSLTFQPMFLGTWFYAASICLFVGFRSQLAALLLGAQILTLRHYVGFVQHTEPMIHHHIHTLGLAVALLAFAPCGKSYSVDRWLALRRGEGPPERGNLLGMRLILVLLSSIYLWGTFSKLTPGFVSGARMTQIFQSLFLGSDPLSPLGMLVMYAMSYGTLLTEPFLAIAIWVPRLRWPAVLVGIAFHLGLYYLLPVTIFSATMILLYLAVFDADDVHAFLDRIQAQPARDG